MGYKALLVSDAHSSWSQDAARLIEQWNDKLGKAGVRVIAAADVSLQKSEEV